MEHVHESCLLEWLDKSDTHTCPHCNEPYTVETTYPSYLHEMLDTPVVPTIIACILMCSILYAFHLGFAWVKRKICHMWFKSGERSSFGGSVLHSRTSLGIGTPPEMLSFLGAFVPGGRILLPLLMEGSGRGDMGLGRPYVSSTPAVNRLDVASIYCDLQMCAMVICGLYMLTKKCLVLFGGTYGEITTSQSDGDEQEQVADGERHDDVTVEAFAGEGRGGVDTDVDERNSGPEGTEPTSTSTSTPVTAYNRCIQMIREFVNVVEHTWENCNEFGEWQDDLTYVFPMLILYVSYRVIRSGVQSLQENMVRKTRRVQCYVRT